MVFKFVSKERIKNLPKESGVYCLKDEGKILYIGKAANLRERVKSYSHPVKYLETVILPKAKLFNRVKRIGYVKTNSEIEALILEANLIKKYQPKYNVVWKDDKNYFFITITRENYPRISITHQLKNLKSEISNLKSFFIGPFVDGKTLKETLKILRKVFPYRSCKSLPKRPCLWYQLGRCPAPCLLKISVYKEKPPVSFGGKIKKECQRNAKNLMKILKEGKNKVLKELKREMKLASKNQEFETAGKIRDQISALEKMVSHSKIFEPKVETLNWPKIQEKLREILKTKKRVSRIEAYDVSNIQGEKACGSMVTFINGLPDKNFYRKFKINPVKSLRSKFNRVKIAGGPNDIAMLKDCLNRRFKHKEWPYPDLILIDGGSSQLNVGLKLKMENEKLKIIPIIALAKKENKLYIEHRKKPILLKNLPREIFNLILQLRDEAHRFAITYHKKLRELDFYPKS